MQSLFSCSVCPPVIVAAGHHQVTAAILKDDAAGKREEQDVIQGMQMRKVNSADHKDV